VITDDERETFRVLAKHGLTGITSDEQIEEYYAWLDDLAAEGVRYGYPPFFWKLWDGILWLKYYIAGMPPSEVLEGMERRKRKR
jgi:hypothetical protein